MPTQPAPDSLARPAGFLGLAMRVLPDAGRHSLGMPFLAIHSLDREP
jgi:hypothetical protein